MIGFALAAAMAAASPSVTPARLPPVERCGGDPSFAKFRAALTSAIAKKDVAALRLLVAPDIRSNFGGDGSWKEFSQTWSLGAPAKSELWREMSASMAMGCAKTESGGRVFPSLFEDTGDDVDPFELLVVRPGATIHSRPDDKSAILTRGDWTTTTQLESQAPDGWVNVAVKGGPTGWVRTASVISPLGYRMVAEKRRGRWLVAAFVAGD